MFRIIKSWIAGRRIKKLIKSVKLESRKYDDLLSEACHNAEDLNLKSLIEKLRINKLKLAKFESIKSHLSCISDVLYGERTFFKFCILFKNEDIKNGITYFTIISRYTETYNAGIRQIERYEGTFMKKIIIPQLIPFESPNPISIGSACMSPIELNDQIKFDELNERELNKLLDYFCLCNRILSSHLWDIKNKKTKNQELLDVGIDAISTIIPSRSLEGGQLSLTDDKNQNGQLTIKE